jgi:hypothetical protein
LAFYCARLAVIDDEIAEGELHLLRLCPQSWITAERETAFENMRTLYGTVSLRFRLTADKQTLEVRFLTSWHQQAPKVILHAPPARRNLRVVVNGVRYAATSHIVLEQDKRRL